MPPRLKRRHVCAEKCHQQDKPINRPARDEIVLSSVSEKFMAQGTEHQDHNKVYENDSEVHFSPQSPRALTKAAISNVAAMQ